MKETVQEKQIAKQVLIKENQERQYTHNLHQTRAHSALEEIGESDVNKRYNTRKKQYIPSQHDYKRSERTRSSVDSYQHHKGALKKLTP